MCGIFGFSCSNQSSIGSKTRIQLLKNLFLLSESRGKEAAGLSINTGREIIVLKSPFSASQFVKEKYFHQTLKECSNYAGITFIGHSRLVTNGYEHFNINNQPVIKSNIVAVHNGIIVNNDELWKIYTDEKKLSDLDSELIPTLFRRFMNEKYNLNDSISKLFEEIYGMTSTAMIFADFQLLILATNNGSLYFVFNKERNCFIFASEQIILERAIEKSKLQLMFEVQDIRQLKSSTFLALGINDFNYHQNKFNNEVTDSLKFSAYPDLLQIVDKSDFLENKNAYFNTSLENTDKDVSSKFREHIVRCREKIQALKRCKICILPETFPFIEFDNEGVCNYCRNYKSPEYKGIDQLKCFIEPYRSKTGKIDCLVPFSGGRDSSYALHFIKKELDLNPLAYSYDWGMLTNLARRNQARMCGKLGIEHILISADIRKKRANIHKNVLAWLKKPHLGSVPLFMAGDKQYFYYANLLMKEHNLEVSILGENLLETTRFKSGFCGIRPMFNTKNTYTLSHTDKIKMLLFYTKEFLKNPAYINSSLLDTLDAFKSYYIIKHQNINLYNYIPWREEIIEKTLIDNYDWETDPGTRTTWRIGDGTAAFYNYIYFHVAGFSENDTFRSNQIREGLLDRKTALDRAFDENFPRWDSLKWYCDTIQIDFEKTIDIINQIEPLYKL